MHVQLFTVCTELMLSVHRSDCERATQPYSSGGGGYDFPRLKTSRLTALSGVGSSPALATCETSHVLLAGVSGGFPGVLPFRPPIDWLVSMSEIILKGTLN